MDKQVISMICQLSYIQDSFCPDDKIFFKFIDTKVCINFCTLTPEELNSLQKLYSQYF